MGTPSLTDNSCRYPFHLFSDLRHYLRCQVHRSRSCHRGSCWVRSWYWISLRLPHHWIRQEPLPQAAAFLLRHSRICPVRGHGPVLSYDGLPPPPCILSCSVYSRSSESTLALPEF